MQALTTACPVRQSSGRQTEALTPARHEIHVNPKNFGFLQYLLITSNKMNYQMYEKIRT